MARRNDMGMAGGGLSEHFLRQQDQALDKGADMLKTINALQGMTEDIYGRTSGELTMAIDEMESVVQHLAAHKSGGSLEATRQVLDERGLGHILGD